MFASYLLDYDLEPTTKHGIDKLHLMVKFIAVIESDSSTGEKEFEQLKLWLVEQLARNRTKQEELNLAEAILKYLQSEPMTNERNESMETLFLTKFLEDIS